MNKVCSMVSPLLVYHFPNFISSPHQESMCLLSRQHLPWRHWSKSGISQLKPTRFWWHFKGSFLGTSRADSSYQLTFVLVTFVHIRYIVQLEPMPNPKTGLDHHMVNITQEQPSIEKCRWLFSNHITRVKPIDIGILTRFFVFSIAGFWLILSNKIIRLTISRG